VATLLNPVTPSGASRTRPLATTLHLWHLASLDAPTVALVWAAALARVAGVSLRPTAAILLPLTVWVIYAADRLLDARRARISLLRERHIFHWRHRRVLVPLIALAAAGGLSLACIDLPLRALRPDSAAAAVTLGWMACVHTRLRLPERFYQLAVGLIFAAGCALPVATRLVAVHSHTFPIFPTLGFAALAWLNLHAIHQWESPHSAHSIRLPAVLLAVTALACAAVSTPLPATLLATQAASALLIALLDRLRPRITPLTLRAAADFVLLVSALLLVV
jgi:hypothetical protein